MSEGDRAERQRERRTPDICPCLSITLTSAEKRANLNLEGHLESCRTNLLQEPQQINLQNLRLQFLIHSLRSCYLVLEIFRIQGLKMGSSLATLWASEISKHETVNLFCSYMHKCIYSLKTVKDSLALRINF